MKKDKTPLPLRRQLGVKMVETFNLVYDRSQLFFAGYDLTSQQYNVLKILHDAGKPLSTSEILEQMVEKNAGVSRLVDRLVAKQLVKKEVNATDKRLIDACLTQPGEALLKKVTARLEKIDSVYSGLTDKEVKELIHLLDKIRQA